MTAAEFERIVTSGQESRGVEFKGPGSWTEPGLRAHLVRSSIAMANKRDGGIIVIGMVEEAGRPGYHVPRGITEEQRLSFDPDVVIPQVNAHAVPHVELSIVHHERPSGEHLVALEVNQFRDYPVLCTRPIVGDENRVVVPAGRLLVRSRRTVETTELQTADDLRELTDLAIDRGLETYFRRRQLEAAAAEPTDDQRFAEELGPVIM